MRFVNNRNCQFSIIEHGIILSGAVHLFNFEAFEAYKINKFTQHLSTAGARVPLPLTMIEN